MNYLTDPAFLSLIGSIIAFIGTVVLTFSLGGVLREFRIAVNALSMTIESITGGGDICVFTGLEKRIKTALKKSMIPTMIGLGLIMFSVVVQGYSINLSTNQSAKTSVAINEVQQSLNENKQQLSTLQVTSVKLNARIQSIESKLGKKKGAKDNL